MRLYPIIHHFTRHDRELINTTSTRGSLGKEGAILQSEVERDLRSTLNSPAVVERLNRLSTETGLSIDTLKSYATIAIAGYAKASYRLSKQQPPSHINAIVTACLYDVYILARTLHRFGFKKSNSDAQLYALLSRFSPHALSVLIEKYRSVGFSNSNVKEMLWKQGGSLKKVEAIFAATQITVEALAPEFEGTLFTRNAIREQSLIYGGNLQKTREALNNTVSAYNALLRDYDNTVSSYTLSTLLKMHGGDYEKVKHIIDKGSAVSDKLYIYFEGFFNNHDIRTQVFLKGADEKKAKAFLEKARTVVLTLQKEFIPLPLSRHDLKELVLNLGANETTVRERLTALTHSPSTQTNSK